MKQLLYFLLLIIIHRMSERKHINFDKRFGNILCGE